MQNVMGVLYSATNFQGMFNLMNVRPSLRRKCLPFKHACRKCILCV